jgi:hypothetical protein
LEPRFFENLKEKEIISRALKGALWKLFKEKQEFDIRKRFIWPMVKWSQRISLGKKMLRPGNTILKLKNEMVNLYGLNNGDAIPSFKVFTLDWFFKSKSSSLSKKTQIEYNSIFNTHLFPFVAIS